ncbi:hypothetical protein PspLS_04767 [Pyricularia sp. CBS 133598]|nr:hypothetical protein PspLS_04767 [Pyricularia sp. CBS 133598]
MRKRRRMGTQRPELLLLIYKRMCQDLARVLIRGLRRRNLPPPSPGTTGASTKHEAEPDAKSPWGRQSVARKSSLGMVP